MIIFYCSIPWDIRIYSPMESLESYDCKNYPDTADRYHGYHGSMGYIYTSIHISDNVTQGIRYHHHDFMSHGVPPKNLCGGGCTGQS